MIDRLAQRLDELGQMTGEQIDAVLLEGTGEFLPSQQPRQLGDIRRDPLSVERRPDREGPILVFVLAVTFPQIAAP
jgi:hypothetical protein